MKDVLLVLCPPVWHKLPPLGLAYIMEYLKSNGYSVDVVDLNVEEVDVLDVASNYDWIGFSVFKSNEPNTLDLVKRIRQRSSHIKIILGGPQCFSWQFTGFPYEVRYVDSVVIGDPLPPLDERPFPTFSGFKLPRYERKRALPIIASRGCIGRCRFCSERLLTDGFQVRNPEGIVAEIRYHKKVNNTKWFTFHDSLINGNLRHLEELCDLLIGEEIYWDAQAIIRQDMPEGLLVKMKKSGCFNLFIGLESGSDKILKLMRKGFTTVDASNFFRKCKSVGLHFEISLIVGYPGETEEDFHETLDFILRNKEYIPKIAQVNPYIKYPGTDLEQPPLEIGLRRVQEVIRLVEGLGIKYTPEFINNLL